MIRESVNCLVRSNEGRSALWVAPLGALGVHSLASRDRLVTCQHFQGLYATVTPRTLRLLRSQVATCGAFAVKSVRPAVFFLRHACQQIAGSIRSGSPISGILVRFSGRTRVRNYRASISKRRALGIHRRLVGRLLEHHLGCLYLFFGCRDNGDCTIAWLRGKGRTPETGSTLSDGEKLFPYGIWHCRALLASFFSIWRHSSRNRPAKMARGVTR